MNIRKAVITAAGPDQDGLPLQRFVDLDGREKTALQIILEEVRCGGRRGDLRRGPLRRPAGLSARRPASYARMLAFVEQPAAARLRRGPVSGGRASSATSRSYTW